VRRRCAVTPPTAVHRLPLPLLCTPHLAPLLHEGLVLRQDSTPASVSFPRMEATIQGRFSPNLNERGFFPQIQDESSLLLDSVGDHDHNPLPHLLDLVPLYMVHLGSPHDTFPQCRSHFQASPPTPSRSAASRGPLPGREAQSESPGAAHPSPWTEAHWSKPPPIISKQRRRTPPLALEETNPPPRTIG
jgi:hypothetical protein